MGLGLAYQTLTDTTEVSISKQAVPWDHCWRGAGEISVDRLSKSSGGNASFGRGWMAGGGSTVRRPQR